jgi:MFS family permease
MTVALATMVMFGALSDRVGRRPVYLFGAVGLMVVAFPFFWLLDTKMPVLVILAFIIGNTICHAAMIGTQPSFFSELFSPDVRYSGVALGHEIASVFAGGLSPLIATALLATYQSAWPVALYLACLGGISVVAVILARKPVPTANVGALAETTP